VQELACRAEERVARKGQLHLVRRSPQQVAADEALQAAYLAAQGRLGQVEAGRGAAEVELLGHRDERSQVAQLDPVGGGWQWEHPAGLGPGEVIHVAHSAAGRSWTVMPLAHRRHAQSAFPFARPAMRRLPYEAPTRLPP
jgi:hypothetical protein